MTFFRVLWGFDAAIALVFLYFFFIGLADGTVSTANGGLWFMLLAALGAVLSGGYWLHTHQQQGWATALLCVLALPGLLAGLFFLFVLITNPRWN